MAAATAVSHTCTRSKSNPTFRQSCRQSDAVDPIELTRRLELYRLEEEVKKRYRRRSAGQYLTNQPLFNEHRPSFNIVEINNDHLARSLEFYRRSLHAESQTPRPKSAYASQSRPRSTAVEADELARRLEAHLNSSRKGQWTTYTPIPPRPAAPGVETYPTRSRPNSQKRPKPSRPKSLPTSAASHPRYHHAPTNVARDLSSTATPDALDATKVHRLSQGVLHRYANPSITYAAPEGSYNPRTLDAARQRTQAYNDTLAARNNFQNTAVIAEAALHDRQRQRRHDGGGTGKAPTRVERQALRHERSLHSLSSSNGTGTGNGRHKPRPRNLPGATTANRSNSGRAQRFDSPQEDVPSIPCTPRLPSDKNDWTQADEAVASGDPSWLSVVGLARKLSRRSVGSSTARAEKGDGGEVVLPPTPRIVVSDEAERWREKALVMREEAVARARALREERERRERVGRSGGERARWKPVVGAGSGVAAAAAAATSSPALATPPPAASPGVPLPPPPPPPPVATMPDSKRMTSDWSAESGTEHMTLESRRLLEQQMRLLRRRTLEEKALREAVEQVKERDERLEVPTGQRADGSTPVPARSLRQQDRAASQRPPTAGKKPAVEDLADKKQRGVGETLKGPDAEKQKRRGCFGKLWS